LYQFLFLLNILSKYLSRWWSFYCCRWIQSRRRNVWCSEDYSVGFRLFTTSLL